ncbi:hypothetical protein, partial [Marinobacter adhaerens]|uniref:hypothetical protein n=1 Tax=Marinobacter adhaerens TaxID=1033846 RepID=UPI003F5CF071
VRIHPWGIRHPWSLPPLSDLEKLIQKYRTLLGSSWIKDWGQVSRNATLQIGYCCPFHLGPNWMPGMASSGS